jgi:hypothetical protein
MRKVKGRLLDRSTNRRGRRQPNRRPQEPGTDHASERRNYINDRGEVGRPIR